MGIGERGDRGGMNRRQFLSWTLGSTLAGGIVGASYGRFEAGYIQVTRHTIAVPRLPAPFAGKTIALLTDIHHGPFNSLPFIHAIVERANSLKPDLIALGGDFIQGPRRPYAAPCLAALGCLEAPLGVYAVPGNHDYLGRCIGEIHRGMRDNGIVDLTNDGRWIELHGSRLRIAGVDDLWRGEPYLPAALGDATTDDACVLLSHNPDFAETLTDPRVGLMLSGHLHGGQIVIPGLGYHCIPSDYGLKYLEGLVQAPCTQVFVSRGLGTVGIPLRFRCPPEINLITLA
jgi:predicted MPP superfamily phosphohydrolase